MLASVEARIFSALGVHPSSIEVLSGGYIDQVYKVSLESGDIVVAKLNRRPNALLEREAFMLEYLDKNTRLPVPKVFYRSNDLLLMEFLKGNSLLSRNATEEAAELLAELHSISSKLFGFERDTLYGGLHQPNSWTVSWVEFFAEQRLLYMGQQALRSGRLPTEMFIRLEKFIQKLGEFLEEPKHTSLIHGDVWKNNILADGDKIIGFIDPAIYFAHLEVELAFIVFYKTFDDRFFDRYSAFHTIQPGFAEERCDIYNLYHMLFHIASLGNQYLPNVDFLLKRFVE